jgi:hypothetical protein
MSMLLRFVRRDARDMVLGWIILAIGTFALAVFGNHIHQPGMDFFTLYPFLIFGMVYMVHVWNSQQNGISREYLLSLPVSRGFLFFIQWGRVMVGLLPSFIYLFVKIDRVAHYFRMPSNSCAVIAVLGLLLATPGLTMTTNSLTAMQKASGRHIRLLMIARYFLELLALAASVWSQLSLIFRVTFVVFSLVSWRLAYLRWLWGLNTPLWREMLSRA